MPITIQIRHDTAADWTSVNPVLALGEEGHETDTGRNKIGDGSTAWSLLPYIAGSVFDVRLYGATGNGTTDDTTNVQSAITACANAGGGVVYFPKGRYLISSPLLMSSAIFLEGAGNQASVLVGASSFPNTTHVGVVQFGSSSYTTTGPTITGAGVRDLGFDLTATPDTTANQINAIYQCYCVMQDITIERIWYSGQTSGICILMEGLGNGQVGASSKGITIKDVYAINGGGTVDLYLNANDAACTYSSVLVENIHSFVTIANIIDDRVAIVGNFPVGTSSSIAYMQGITVRNVFINIAAGATGLVNGVKVDTGEYTKVQNIHVDGVHYQAQTTGANGNPVVMYGESFGFLQDVIVENIQTLNSNSLELFLCRFAAAPSLIIRNVQMENCLDVSMIRIYTATNAVGDEQIILDGISGSSGATPSTYSPVGICLASGNSSQGASGMVKIDNTVLTGFLYGITTTINDSVTGTSATAYSNISIGNVNLTGCTHPLSLSGSWGWNAVGTVFNVKSYGATGNGTTDDTAAIQATLTAAAAAGGGTTFFPSGTYLVSSALSCGGGSPGSVTVQGTGWDSEILLANGANCYIFDMGSGGNPVYTPGPTFKDLYLNCNAANQTGVSGGIFARGSCFGIYEHVWFEAPYDAGLRFYEDGLGDYGHHNRIIACLFQDGYLSASYGQGLRLDHCDENSVIGCTFQDNGTTTYPSAQLYDTSSGLQTIQGCSFVTTRSTAVTMFKTDSSPSRCSIIGCQFDSSTTGNQLELNGPNCMVTGCVFLNFGTGNAAIHISSSDTVIQGNQFASSGSTGQAVAEDASLTGNLIVNNVSTGSYNTVPYVLHTGAARSNPGFNPATVSAPAFPTTTATYTNIAGVDLYAYVTNGTGAMTTSINGHTGPAIGALATAVIFIPVGGTFTPTYGSGSPSWLFQGN